MQDTLADMQALHAYVQRASNYLDLSNGTVHYGEIVNKDHYVKPLKQADAMQRVQENVYTLRGFYARVALVAILLGEVCTGRCFWTLAFLGTAGAFLYVTVSDLLTRERKVACGALLVLYALLFTPIIPVAFVSCCVAAVACTGHAAVYVAPASFT